MLKKQFRIVVNNYSNKTTQQFQWLAWLGLALALGCFKRVSTSSHIINIVLFYA